jgi:hypothetical protein
MPGVKSVGAEGLHEVGARSGFRPQPDDLLHVSGARAGEAPGNYPLETLYDNVWSKPLADRRVMKIGREKVARARLSDDARRLENVEVIGDGIGERRIVVAADGQPLHFRRGPVLVYESDLDGLEKPFLENLDERRNFTGRVMHINRDGSIPRSNPWLSRSTVFPETWAHGFKDPEWARDSSANRRPVVNRSRSTRRR